MQEFLFKWIVAGAETYVGEMLDAARQHLPGTAERE
jgi:hypothetical protein